VETCFLNKFIEFHSDAGIFTEGLLPLCQNLKTTVQLLKESHFANAMRSFLFLLACILCTRDSSGIATDNRRIYIHVCHDKFQETNFEFV